MSTSIYVDTQTACEQLGVTQPELAKLASLRKIRTRFKLGTGVVYDTQEYIARSGSPPEAPAAPSSKIAITPRRLLLALVVGAVLVPLLLSRLLPPIISPPKFDLSTVIPSPVVVAKPEPQPVKKKPLAKKRDDTLRYFW